MRVLIAEDDFVSRRYLSQFMKGFGDVDIAVDGAEAVDAFIMAVRNGEYYDLVCLDIMMPNMNGIEALQAIRAVEEGSRLGKGQVCKIIMMSALNEKKYVQRASEMGCNGYANKPVSLNKLMEVMKRMGLPVG